ncbi:hypothetical protein EV197_0894 [Aquimarina brevivitae]|uniref:Uncharacterized protein n=1 Tax=Aquimarina brevivitae TaxID=323412 RepID=A0A4Q7PGN1_9FLAO|nr:hypothetical protein EV197_0894 [Aquimarina brevivitae]
MTSIKQIDLSVKISAPYFNKQADLSIFKP